VVRGVVTQTETNRAVPRGRGESEKTGSNESKSSMFFHTAVSSFTYFFEVVVTASEERSSKRTL